jgi:ribosomal protein L40E
MSEPWSEPLVCWKCGASLKALPLPLGRRAECLACHAELHVCRQCRHFDPGKAKQCREPMAEEVKDKGRANFCDWFQPRTRAHQAGARHQGDGRQALDALFGNASGQPSDPEAGSELDRLFGD